mmetsp:Transcript_43399/g.136022  ORF Transcript_43399/g.136022 Transcript_43399/m.136022 type:complete len:377 (-) Transcript_43399:644-1774(-)
MWSFLLCDQPLAPERGLPHADSSPGAAPYDDTIEGETSSGELLVSRGAGLKRQRPRVAGGSPTGPGGRGAISLVPPQLVATPDLARAGVHLPHVAGVLAVPDGTPASPSPEKKDEGPPEATESIILTLLVAAFIVAATCYPPAPPGNANVSRFFPALDVEPEQAAAGPATVFRAAAAYVFAFLRTLLFMLAAMAALKFCGKSRVALLRERSGATPPHSPTRQMSVDDSSAEALLAQAAGPEALPVATPASPRARADSPLASAAPEGFEAPNLRGLKEDLRLMMQNGGQGRATLPKIFTDAYLEQVLTKPGRSYDYTRSKLGKCLAFRRNLKLDPGPALINAETRSVLSTGCLYWHGFDKDGRPIIWAHPSRVDWYP